MLYLSALLRRRGTKIWRHHDDGESNVVTETDANGNAMLPKKSLTFRGNRHKISVSLAMSTNLQKKKKIKTFNPKKIIPGQMLGEDRPEKKSAKC